MNEICLKHGTLIIDGQERIDDGAIIISQGSIHWVGKSNDPYVSEWELCHGNAADLFGKYVFPGYIDVHMHGAAGHDVIEGSQKAIDAISTNIVQDGCTAFFGSLTVVSHDETCHILSALSTCCASKKGAQFLGIHVEGPYLSKTYKALMDETYLRDPNINEIQEMLDAGHGKVKYITMAPELDRSEEAIRYLTKQGVHVMIGHSNASVNDVKRAYLAGAKGFTHLYNAMSQHTHRNPGVVTAAYVSRNMIAELICDGFHVDPYVVETTYQILGAKRIALITDSMPGKGMEDGEYVFSHLLCVKKGKTVTVKETGRIAGSCIGMDDAVKRMRKFCGCSLEDLVQMACVNPSILAHVSKTKGTLEAGKDADIIVLDPDLNVCMTFVKGMLVYEK